MSKLNAEDIKVDVVASADYSFEAVAEDGTTRVYALVPSTSASDAFVLSDVYEVLETPARIVGKIPFGTGVGTFLAGIVPAKGATVKLLSSTGQERLEGKIGFGDQILVTSEDGEVSVVYKLQFIGSVLAYVTSDVYTVDAEKSHITGVPVETDVTVFLANLVPSSGSVMMLLDSAGTEKTTGMVVANDEVYVVSGDGVNNVTYMIMLNPVSVKNVVSDAMSVYPNPASSVLYVENIPEGTYVRVSDITGRTALLQRSSEITRGIDLSDLSNGVYLLSVEKNGEKIMTTRFIKK
jgi:hypothetical protein